MTNHFQHHVQGASEYFPGQKIWTTMGSFPTDTDAEQFCDWFLLDNPDASGYLRITNNPNVKKSDWKPEDFRMLYSTQVRVPQDIRRSAQLGHLTRVVTEINVPASPLAKLLHQHPDSLIGAVRVNRGPGEFCYFLDPEPEQLAENAVRYGNPGGGARFMSPVDDTMIVAKLFTPHAAILDTLLDPEDDFIPTFSTALAFLLA